jgi:hypothetical protein
MKRTKIPIVRLLAKEVLLILLLSSNFIKVWIIPISGFIVNISEFL